MLLTQATRTHGESRYDLEGSYFSGEVQLTSFGQYLPSWAAPVSRELGWSSLDLFIAQTLPVHGGETVSFDFGAHPPHQEDELIDGLLPRLPLRVQSIRARLRISGEGAPRFRTDTEVSLRDSE